MSYLSVDVFDQFVQVFEPLIGVFVLKITAHSHDDVVGGKAVRLVLRCLDESSHAFRNIVVVQAWIVLEEEEKNGLV